MTTTITAALFLLVFALGWVVRGFAEKDRRVEHIVDATPTWAQLRAWSSERSRSNPGLRVVRGGRP